MRVRGGSQANEMLMGVSEMKRMSVGGSTTGLTVNILLHICYILLQALSLDFSLGETLNNSHYLTKENVIATISHAISSFVHTQWGKACTCSGSEGEGVTARSSIQRVDLNDIAGTRLET